MLTGLSTSAWTLAQLDRLPDDGNKYELIDGELFVTPVPSPAHERLSAVLNRLLGPYVWAQRLGYVYTPRAVVRTNGSEVEPDLMRWSQTICVVRRDADDLVAETELEWHPEGASESLRIEIAAYFDEALGPR